MVIDVMYEMPRLTENIALSGINLKYNVVIKRILL